MFTEEDKYYKNNTGHVIQVYQQCLVVDEFDNPVSSNYDTLFNYYTWQRQYESMQEHSYREVDDWFDAQISEGAFYRLREKCQAEGKSHFKFLDALCDALDKVGIVAFPILAYDHPEITYYLGDSIDRWDDNFVGFAWQYKEKLYKEYGCKRIIKSIREKLEKSVKDILKTYSLYCNGYVYGYNVFDRYGVEIDGGSGFISDSDKELLGYVIDCLPSEIEDTNFVVISIDEAEELVA
jgi:hypothetical protein